MITKFVERFTGSHLPALVSKEMNEIVRNKYLVFLLLVPPVIQLLILGAALDPQVRNLTLGVVDYARSQESRDLIATMTGSGIFSNASDLPNEKEVTRQLEEGKLDTA